VAEPMRVAYLIGAYRLPEQTARLVRRLAVPGVAFVIHIDRKSDPAVEAAVREGVAGVPNCHFLDPQPVHWAHWSVVEVTLRGLSALHELGLDPAQTVPLSGQDYPVAPPEGIAARLDAEPEIARVRHAALPKLDWWPNDRGGLDRFERYWLRLPRRGMTKTPLRRRIPHGWAPYGGAANCMLGRPHREHLLRLLDRDRRAVRFFRHANVPDEIFFQTALMNSPLRDSVRADNLLFARWQEGANHPDLLGVGDLDEALASPALFARKFDGEHDPDVLDELDRRLDREGSGGPASKP